jgi:hypothetical protein
MDLGLQVEAREVVKEFWGENLGAFYQITSEVIWVRIGRGWGQWN